FELDSDPAQKGTVLAPAPHTHSGRQVQYQRRRQPEQEREGVDQRGRGIESQKSRKDERAGGQEQNEPPECPTGMVAHESPPSMLGKPLCVAKQFIAMPPHRQGRVRDWRSRSLPVVQ